MDLKIRRVIIAGLAIVNLSLLIYVLIVSFASPKGIKAENVIIHETIEQMESMVHPDFVKEEYVPIVIEGDNIAKGKKVSASSFYDVYTPRKVTDGVFVGVSYWEGAPDSYPNILTVNLEEIKSIHTVRVCLSPMSIWGKRTQTFSVNISNDNEIFTELIPEQQYTFDPDTGNEVVLTFDTVDVKYVQLKFTENSGATGAQVAEFEVYAN